MQPHKALSEAEVLNKNKFFLKKDLDKLEALKAKHEADIKELEAKKRKRTSAKEIILKKREQNVEYELERVTALQNQLAEKNNKLIKLSRELKLEEEKIKSNRVAQEKEAVLERAKIETLSKIVEGRVRSYNQSIDDLSNERQEVLAHKSRLSSEINEVDKLVQDYESKLKALQVKETDLDKEKAVAENLQEEYRSKLTDLEERDKVLKEDMETIAEEYVRIQAEWARIQHKIDMQGFKEEINKYEEYQRRKNGST